MTKTQTLSCLVALALLIGGCSLFHTDATKKIEQHKQQIAKTETKISTNTRDTLDQIGKLSFGIQSSLNHSNQSVASTLNNRILTLSPYPSLEDQLKMEQLVLDLMAKNAAGNLELQKLDKEIFELQNQLSLLTKQQAKNQQNLSDAATSVAKDADKAQAELAEFTGWFGLKAVFKGLAIFVRTSFLALLIGIVALFFVRMAASTNPLANAAYMAFTHFVSIFIHGLEMLFPHLTTVVTKAKEELSK